MATNAKAWCDKGNEKAKPTVKKEVLEIRKAKATAIKSFQEKQKAERARKYETSKPGQRPKGEKIMGFANKIATWRENFRKYRKKQKQFSQWVRAADFFPVVVYGGPDSAMSRSTFDLSNFQELNIPQDESYNFFNRCWMKYDKNGSGRLKYGEFEMLLKDIGFEFGRPSWKEVDPERTKKITWRRAVVWWSKSTEPAEKALNRVNAAKIKAVKQKRRERYAKNSYEAVELLSKQQLARARKNARTKLSAKRMKFREFRKANKGKLNPRMIVDVYKGKDLHEQYDVTDYKSLTIDAPLEQQKMVEFVWKKYDKNGVGSMSFDAFTKMFEEQKLTGETPFAQKGKKVQFTDFIQWWFADTNKSCDEEEKQQETPSKRKRKKVSQRVKEFQEKMALQRSKRSKFRKSRKKDMKERDPWKVEIFTKSSVPAFEYSLKNYEPAFIPAGKETQLQQLDLIWKSVDKEGRGVLDASQFQRLLKKQGLDLTSTKALQKLQGPDKRVTFEKFSTWWFTANQDLVPRAPPAPEAKKQKASTIRSSVAAINKTHTDKYKLVSDDQWAENRFEAQKIAQVESDKFRKYRIANSPMKSGRSSQKTGVFDVEIRYKDRNLEVQGTALNF